MVAVGISPTHLRHLCFCISRQDYSTEERLLIVRYILDNKLTELVGGIAIWKDMERKQVRSEK